MSDFTPSEYANFDPRLPIAATGLVIVGLFSLPSIFAILTQTRRNAPKDNFYEDADGKSTPEAVADFSNKKAKIAISIFSVASFATSVVVSVLATLRPVHFQAESLSNWLTTASFVCVSQTLVASWR